MREGATLKLDNGTEVRVDVDPADLEHDEIVLRRMTAGSQRLEQRLAALDRVIAAAPQRPAGTTDRQLAADRAQ